VPDHPDHEQLAALQAGDGDRRQLADLQAHLAGCPSCAEVVASVERARRRLALLEEPDLPPGLHDRLAAALDAEAARTPVERPVSRFGRAAPRTGPAGAPARAGPPGSPARPRPVPWYWRRVAWGAAAALLLAALVAVPLLDRSSEVGSAGGAGGGQAAQDLAGPEAAAGTVPVLRVPGEVSAATVRARLSSDTRARAALAAATAGARGARAAPPGGSSGTGGATKTPGGSGGTAGATQSPAQPGGGTGAEAPPTGAQASGGAASGAGAAALRSCLPEAAAAASPATRPLAPAFYLEGRFRGRAATILVTASTGQPGRVDLWVFPRGNCSGPPLATERVR
jgi:hypothetical protein